MDEKRLAEKIELNQVVNQFRQLLNEYKDSIRISVLEELVESCYGPQALLNGRKITNIADFKDWLETKLQEEKQQQGM
jgi:hypothetical protein